MWRPSHRTALKSDSTNGRGSSGLFFAFSFFLIFFAIGCATVQSNQKLQWGEGDPLPPETEDRIAALAHFATGISHELNEDSADATDEFLQSALLDPGQADLVLDVTRRLLREKRGPEAVALLQTAISETENPPGEYFTWLGIVYLQSGETNLATEVSESAILLAPQDPGAYQTLAQIYTQTARTNDALRVIHTALQQTNAPAEFLLTLVDLVGRFNRQQLINDNVARANTSMLLDLAASRTEENPVIQQRIAELYMMQGDSAKAQPLYEALFRQFPDAPGIREKLANIYLRSEQNEKAAEMLEQLRRDKPTDPSPYFFLGSIAADAKKPEKAKEYFETAIQLNPNFEPAYYELAGVQIGMDKPEEALKTLDKARAKFKLNFVLEFYTAIANTALEKFSEALSHFTSAELIAKTSDPSRLNYVFYFQLGAAQERSGNIEEAVKAFRKCLELSPDYPEALNYLGYMWADRGENLEEAKELIERALKKEPNNAAYLDSLAWVYYKMQKPTEALNYINSAVAHSEKPDPALLEHLGDIHLELKQVEQARDAYSKALAIKPDQKIQKKLETLGLR
jgi:tetratricopeptide (TPR) repeat protein